MGLYRDLFCDPPPPSGTSSKFFQVPRSIYGESYSFIFLHIFFIFLHIFCIFFHISFIFLHISSYFLHKTLGLGKKSKLSHNMDMKHISITGTWTGTLPSPSPYRLRGSRKASCNRGQVYFFPTSLFLTLSSVSVSVCLFVCPLSLFFFLSRTHSLTHSLSHLSSLITEKFREMFQIKILKTSTLLL